MSETENYEIETQQFDCYGFLVSSIDDCDGNANNICSQSSHSG